MISGARKYLGEGSPWGSATPFSWANNLNWINSVLNPQHGHGQQSTVTPPPNVPSVVPGTGNPGGPANPINVIAVGDPPPNTEESLTDSPLTYWLIAAGLVAGYYFIKKKKK